MTLVSRITLFIWMAVLALPAKAMEMPGDSIGTRIVSGKAYVLHRVDPGDNLTRIAKRYGVSIASIRSVNEMANDQIKVGQVLQVPSTHLPKNPQASQEPEKNRIHIVMQGQTLYAISRIYNVPVEEIKAANGMEGNELSIGQTLKIGIGASVVAENNPDKTEKAGNQPPEQNGASGPAQPKTKIAPKANKPGIHIVGEGETLFGIAKKYDMEVAELKKINRLGPEAIIKGQELKVKSEEIAENSSPQVAKNNNKPLINMIRDVTREEEAGPQEEVKEEFPELEILSTDKGIKAPKEAKVELYKDKTTGKKYKRIEESGTVGNIEDLSTDQTKFYAFHKTLPPGSYVRVDYPEKGQSILVEVINTLSADDEHIVRLSAKCRDYLLLKKEGSEVKLRYVIPLN